MSSIRRKLLLSNEKSGNKFEKVINTINQLPGEKTMLRKFDSSQLVWVLSYATISTMSKDLYVINLNGDILGKVTDIYAFCHHGGVIGNYACIYSGVSNYSSTFDVFELTGSGLHKIGNSPSFSNYATANYFGYKDNSGDYHMSSISNARCNCVFDYNITKNTVRRRESQQHYFIQWYNYDTQYFRGIIFGSIHIRPGYIKRDDTINTITGNYFPPQISDVTQVGDVVNIPLFDYDMSYENTQYEMFYKLPGVDTLYNITGLENPEPVNIESGDIVLSGDSTLYNPYTYGMLSYVENGEFHAYSFNKSTGLVDLMI